jgi:hypothetical protein
MIELIVARVPDSPAVTRVGDDDDDRREIVEDERRFWLVRMFILVNLEKGQRKNV